MTILGPTFCNEPVKIRDLAEVRRQNGVSLDRFPIKTHTRTDHVTGKVEVWHSRACTRPELNESGRTVLAYYADADINYMAALNSDLVNGMRDAVIEAQAEHDNKERELASLEDVESLCMAIEQTTIT